LSASTIAGGPHGDRTWLRLRSEEQQQRENAMQIRDSVFLITGGGSGLGAAAVRELAQAGAKVVVADLDEAAGSACVEPLGAGAIAVQADIRDEAAARRTVAQARERFGALHGLVNCAGVAGGEKILGRQGPHGLDSFGRIVGINLIGTFNMLRLAAEAMADNPPNAEGERGVIVNTASIAAFDGQIGQAAYAASKGGVASMTLPAARELARFGIRVMTVAPGVFETPMMAGMSQEIRDSLAAGVPFPPRLGRPAEYAALVRHIFENPMLNGEVIRLDGALRMAAK
jgi:Dehydrogenases with different specificities (related to short-chain alcohol dehydrogenases)